VAFAPDGKTFATATADGELEVWDAAPFANSSNRVDPAWHARAALDAALAA